MTRLTWRLILSVVALIAFAGQSAPAWQSRDSGYNVSVGGTLPTPQLVYHWATVPNPVGSGQKGTAYKLYIPPVGAGDTIILATNVPNGRTVTITDSASDSSPTALCTADAGSGNFKSSLYAFVPTTGVTWINVGVSGAQFAGFDAEVSEWNNVGTTLQGSASCTASNASTAGVVTPTAISATNNDATGGNLLFNYTVLAGPSAGTPACQTSNYTAGNGFVLLNGDTSTALNGNGFGFQHSTMALVQTTAASIAAKITLTGETCSSGNGDPYNSATVALKVQTSGITYPSTIHVIKDIEIDTFNWASPTVPATWLFPFSSRGNLRVFMFDGAVDHTYAVANTVTSSDGCNFTQSTGSGNDILIFWYAQNCSPCDNCTITFNMTPGGSLNISAGRFYDIANAAASSYVGRAGNNIGAANQTSVTHDPDYTPTNATLILVMGQNGFGPTTGITSPTGVYWTCALYTGQTDGDYMCSGDGHAYYYAPTTAPENWSWSIVSQPGGSIAGTVAEFK